MALTGVAVTCSACSSDPLAVPQRTNIRFADRKSGCKLLTQPREVEWAGKREEVTSDGAGAEFIGTTIRPVQFCLQKARFRAAPPGTSWAQQAGGRSPCPRSGLPPPLSRRVWRTEGQSGQRASGAACGGAALWRQAGLSSAVVSTPTPLQAAGHCPAAVSPRMAAAFGSDAPLALLRAPGGEEAGPARDVRRNKIQLMPLVGRRQQGRLPAACPPAALAHCPLYFPVLLTQAK